jgi:hypothetical protein
MKKQDYVFETITVRLDALIADQERLLQVIREEKAELVGVDRCLPVQPSTRPTSI